MSVNKDALAPSVVSHIGSSFVVRIALLDVTNFLVLNVVTNHADCHTNTRRRLIIIVNYIQMQKTIPAANIARHSTLGRKGSTGRLCRFALYPSSTDQSLLRRKV